MDRFDPNPFKKGCWNHLVVTSNNKKVKLSENGLNAIISENVITLPKGVRVLDLKSEIDVKDKCERISAPTLTYEKGQATIIIPDAKNFNTITLYILA